MSDLRALRDKETLLMRVIELSKEIRILDGNGNATDFTLDTTALLKRLVEVQRQIETALAERRSDHFSDTDWYSNH